jgi:tetratricopeptide (TPR) repeat protein
MLKQILSLLFTFILSINLFAQSPDINKELTDIKLQIQEIKLLDARDDREKKIEKLEKDIKELDNKFNQNNVDKKEIDGKLEKIKDIVDRQDLRLDDLNFYLALYGFLITILLFVASYLSYRFTSSNASEIVQNWIKKNKEEILEPIRNEAKDLQKNIEKEALSFYQEKLKEFRIEDKLDESQKNNQKLILEKVNEILEKKEKNEYTFDDWYSKYLTLKNKKNDLDRAIYFLEKALKHASTDEEKVIALFSKGVTYGQLGNFIKSNESYTKLINKFKDSENNSILKSVKSSLTNKIEINVILGNENLKEDLDLCFSLAKEDKQLLLKFDMLQIFEKAKDFSQNDEIKNWQIKFKDTKLKDWSFDELKTWAQTLENDAKERILRYIDIFENHNKNIEGK